MVQVSVQTCIGAKCSFQEVDVGDQTMQQVSCAPRSCSSLEPGEGSAR